MKDLAAVYYNKSILMDSKSDIIYSDVSLLLILYIFDIHIFSDVSQSFLKNSKSFVFLDEIWLKQMQTNVRNTC